MEQTDKLLSDGVEPGVNGKSKESCKVAPADATMKANYFDMLRLWVHQTTLHQSMNASQCFPYYLMGQGAIQTQSPSGSNNIAAGQTQRDEALGPNGGGYEYIISPIWKRVVAEAIDVAILFLIKLLLSFAIVDILNIDVGPVLDLNTLKTSMEDDYSQLFNLASEIIVLELVTKICVCIYETLWTMEGHNNMGGATPGKLVMGIRILFVESVILVDQDQPAAAGAAAPPAGNGFNTYFNNRVKALLYPARNPGWKRAFCRAFIKNATVIIPVVYPVYFLTFMFRNNRMGYDVLTKTIVVEENQAPVMRRM